MNAFQVRPGVLEDLDEVWPLARDFATSFRPERDEFEQTFRALILVARMPERICGYLLAHTHQTFLANGPVAWVEEVMVDHRDRSQGIGFALMAEAERWGRSQGAAYVSLASRRAGGFYLHLGYEESAVFFKKDVQRPG